MKTFYQAIAIRTDRLTGRAAVAPLIFNEKQAAVEYGKIYFGQAEFKVVKTVVGEVARYAKGKRVK